LAKETLHLTIPQRVLSSPYMNWAKTQSHTRFNMATSGLKHYPLSGLPARLEELAISGPSYYGFPPLQQALTRKCQVDSACVVAANGASMANHLAMAAVLEPGDEVLIEEPTYELLTATAGYLQANIKRFSRRFEAGFALDLAEIERVITPRTRLIVLTNLHNPSSQYTPPEVMKQVGALARSVGARVLVDEIYLDALFEAAPASVFHLGNEFISTNSLTKVYGLSGLRCGWVLAEPELCSRMWLINDLFGVIPAHTAELLSCIALANLPTVAALAENLLTENQQLLNQFLAATPQIEAVPLTAGTVVFPRTNLPVEDVCRFLRERYEASVVPGHFFGREEHFRIGIGGDTEPLREGLDRLHDALSRFGG
jgi:aspartate/methionine/tyrosine aminotransferase